MKIREGARHVVFRVSRGRRLWRAVAIHRKIHGTVPGFRICSIGDLVCLVETMGEVADVVIGVVLALGSSS